MVGNTELHTPIVLPQRKKAPSTYYAREGAKTIANLESGEETLVPARNHNLVVWPAAIYYINCTIQILLLIQF